MPVFGQQIFADITKCATIQQRFDFQQAHLFPHHGYTTADGADCCYSTQYLASLFLTDQTTKKVLKQTEL